MATDELSEPLGPKGNNRDAGAKNRRFGRRALRMLNWSVGALVLFGIMLGGWALLRNDPLGGEPVVVLDMTAPSAVAEPGAARDALVLRETLGGNDTAGEPGADPGGVAIITRLDSSDVDISTPGSGGAIASDTPQVAVEESADRRVVEQANIGILPRIGLNGEKPSDVYAQQIPISAAIGSGEPARIAIMIGGLGISASVTDEAIARLPGPVSLAFAPYGRDLQVRVNQARRAGHEVLLQLPMEPFDYPDNDPGPHTLLADADNSDNMERLYWLMARFTGYFGVTNYMGAKFTSSPDALKPIAKELANRGLAMLDDGSSPRSLVASLAPTQGLSAARADLVIDAAQTRQAIKEALSQLETLARERGYAIASGTALPATIDAIADWAQDLGARGIVLVPVSSALKSSKQS